MMEAVDQHAEAWQGIKNGYESGRLAHAYVIVGSPRGNALQFAESVLKLLFCERADRPCNECVGCRQVEAHKHVDTLWIEPQSKSRQILADDVRGLIQRMTQTSFEGGWKAGVILCADCMNESSENALLKTLEEPPPKSLLLLITDSANSLLPTIISRCQKIVLSEGASGPMDDVWKSQLMNVLYNLPPTGGLGASRLASQFKSMFDRVKEGISDAVIEELDQNDEALDETKLKAILDARTNARLKEVQADVFRVMLDWHRDVLMLTSDVDAEDLIFADDQETLVDQARQHTQGSALQAINVVEGMARRLDRNIPDLQIYDEAFRKMVRR
jgi:DNA polymerase-3 subunit delta'